jgi:hypothetical protein
MMIRLSLAGDADILTHCLLLPEMPHPLGVRKYVHLRRLRVLRMLFLS